MVFEVLFLETIWTFSLPEKVATAGSLRVLYHRRGTVITYVDSKR